MSVLKLTGMSWHLKSPNFLFPQSQRKFLQEVGETLEQPQGLQSVSGHKASVFKIPFGVQFIDVMSIVAFICTGKTNPCRLCRTGSTGVAGKHSLSLHVAL